MIDEVLTADRLTANLDLGSSAGVLQTVTDLNLAVFNGQEINFTYSLSYTNGNNIGIRLAVNCTGTGTFRGGTIQGNSTTSFATSSGTALNTVLFAEGAGSTTPNFAIVSGTFVATSDGTLSLQACNEGSGACVLNSGSGALFLVAGPVSRTPTTLALTTATFAPTVTRATERFTHADQSNSLTAEKTWTTWSGSGYDIVSNQAKALGSASTGAMCRMDVDADLASLVTVEATLVTFTGGDATHFAEARLYLQKDSSSTQTYYAWVARNDINGNQYYLYKQVSGGFTQLGSTVTEAFPSFPFLMTLTWNPASNTLKGYVNGTEKISQVDSAITANTRGGIGFDTNHTTTVVTFDNFYLSNISSNTLVSCAAPTALVLTTFAPTITIPQLVTGAAPTALILTTFAPTVSTPQRVTGAAPTALILTTFDPTVTAIGTASVVPDVIALTLTTFEPTVSVGTRVTGAAPTALTITTFAPTVLTPQVVTPETLNVFLTTYEPTVLTPLLVTPETLGLVLTTFEPTVTAATGGTALVTPDPLALLLATFAPTVTALSGGGPTLHTRVIRGDRPHGLEDWMVSWNG